MERIHFTSDTHFGHKNMIKFAPWSRGQYKDADEMNEDMISIWNERVEPNDIVYHQGDFAFFYGNYVEKVRNVLSRLNGRIFLTLGNHDEEIIKHRAVLTGAPDQGSHCGTFASIENYREVRQDNQKVCLFHFPMAVWNKNHHGSWHLFGHCHGSYPGTGRGKTMDSGWDTKDFDSSFKPGPISWAQVKALMDKRDIVALDHHEATNPR